MERGMCESEQVAATAQQLRSWRAPEGCALLARLAPAAALIAALAFGPDVAQADSARLSLNIALLSFPSADPDSVPSVAAAQNPVQVTVEVRGTGSSQLTVLAGGDLRSGPDQIPIDRITWTAQGSGFTSGTLSRSQPQLVGQWLGKTDSIGQLRFWLQNSWSYAAGSYSQGLVYTLVAY
jgi:hypothetical protein